MIPFSIKLSPTRSLKPPHSPRVSFSPSLKSAAFCSSSSFTPPFRSNLRFSNKHIRSTCHCAVSSLKVNATTELLKEASFKDIKNRSRTFLHAKTEEELLGGMRKEVEAGRLACNVAARMEELYYNYKNAVEDFTNELYKSVTQNHKVLKYARYDNQGLEASTYMVSVTPMGALLK